MRSEPCKKCNMFDFYSKGNFSYCRPCHSEAQKRYANKIGDKELLKAPSYSLEQLMNERSSFNRTKTHCIKGHALTGDNVRVSSQRKGRHLRRMCRTCERNAKRVKYGLSPEPAPKTLGSMLEN